MGFIYYTYHANLLLIVTLAMLVPTSPELVTSVAPDTEDLRLRLLSTCLHTYVYLSFLENSMITSFVLFHFLSSTLDLTGQVIKSGALATSRSIQIHKCLKILFIQFNRCLGLMFGGFHMALILAAVLCTCGALRLSGFVALVIGWVGSNCTAFLVFMLTGMASVSQTSEESMAIMRMEIGGARTSPLTMTDCNILRREMAALTELRVSFGTFFYYDEGLVLTTLDVITQNVVSLLLI